MNRTSRTVAIPPLGLRGILMPPAAGRGVVVFAHGSGSSRLSPRNTAVAATLWQRGLGALLFDLLLPEEGEDRSKVFDIALLARRLVQATDWLLSPAGVGGAVPVGYFGASTGSAAALVAAGERAQVVRAVVSRGGRPDLARPEALRRVTMPTLLLVGRLDGEVLALNRAAAAELGGEHHVAVVEGASHLFAEPGTLETVARLAADWFDARLQREEQA
ncbi:alpha/beta hydrolase [Roseomonas sp. M0104]|uniref:Alpha/beta hydrolase n=1 Tax=Teichococcus coralli TaxID=2545983 RepID=A0A845BAC4_9PROT|nr:alpha/beta family hydrolase [Pseudoroseomonas coralli]MXP63034.1 alpha/beta hydrolase [Pseudoroseomonas coralli]